MSEDRIRVAPNTVVYGDRESDKLVVEFAIPGAPTETIDVKILEDSIHLTAPTKDVEYVSALAFAWPVKPDKAEATYEHGLLRIEVPFKDPMEGAVKIAIKEGGARSKTIEGQWTHQAHPVLSDENDAGQLNVSRQSVSLPNSHLGDGCRLAYFPDARRRSEPRDAAS